MREPLTRFWEKYSLWIAGSAFWLVLTLVHTAVLYIRGRYLLDELAVPDVFFWQALVWAPWIVFPVYAMRVLRPAKAETEKGRRAFSFKPLIPFLALLIFHFFWMIYASHYTSPFEIEGIDQRWGIFRFHLIFWGLIDIMGLGLLAVYFVMGQRRQQAGQSQDDPRRMQKTITIKDRNRTEVVSLNEVICVTSEDYYARIHTERGDFLIRTPLKTLAGEWPEQYFLQTHRSCLINLEYLKTLDRKRNQAVMSDGARCPVSRSGLRRLRAFLEKKG